MRSVIFVTWEGPQTFYLENLFIPLFMALERDKWSFEILQLTWGNPLQIAARVKVAEASGLRFRMVEINRRRGIHGKMLALVRGAWILRKMVLERPNTIVMFRSIMPALLTRLAHVSRSAALIYDSDGLPVDEKLESGEVSPGSTLHRILVSCEAWALKNSSTILARTTFGALELERKLPTGELGKKVHVVSNGRVRNSGHADEHVSELGIVNRSRLVLCYLGSWGKAYRPKTMLKLACEFRGLFPETEFRIFTGDVGRAQADLNEIGLGSADWVTLQTLAPAVVKRNLAQCDIGFSCREPTVSTQAVSPVKLGEYLEAGLAIVGDIVGDCTPALARDKLLFEPESGAIHTLADWVQEYVLANKQERREKARHAAQNFLSLDQSVSEYEKALLSAAKPQRPVSLP